jgi:hypothetical protein
VAWVVEFCKSVQNLSESAAPWPGALNFVKVSVPICSSSSLYAVRPYMQFPLASHLWRLCINVSDRCHDIYATSLITAHTPPPAPNIRSKSSARGAPLDAYERWARRRIAGTKVSRSDAYAGRAPQTLRHDLNPNSGHPWQFGPYMQFGKSPWGLA